MIKPKAKSLITCAVAFLSGLCNALIGAGGGILLSLTLSRLSIDGMSAKKDIYVNAQAAMIPGCILSCVIYAALGSLDPTGFSVFAIPAAIGGALGGLLLTKISNRRIGKLFAALVIWSGARMIIGG